MSQTRTPTNRARTPAERHAKLVALAEQLVAFRDSTSPAEQAEYEARFDHYSALNALRIAMQAPHATVVLSYDAWKALGRRPTKGSGIAILTPHRVGATSTSLGAAPPADNVFGCHITHVFDIADTYERDVV